MMIMAFIHPNPQPSHPSSPVPAPHPSFLITPTEQVGPWHRLPYGVGAFIHNASLLLGSLVSVTGF